MAGKTLCSGLLIITIITDEAQPLFVIIAVVTAYSISNYEYGIAETVTSLLSQ